MIVSHTRRFVFVKTRKTAGTSIEVFLSPHCAGADVVTPVNPPVDGHRAANHRGASNPWRDAHRHATSFGSAARHAVRAERFYNHMPADLARDRVGAEVWESYETFCVERNPWDKTLSHWAMRRDRAGGDLTLDQYLAAGDLCSDIARYTDAAGRVLVDTVVRYEDLANGLGEVFERIGIPFSGDLGTRAKSGHRVDRRPYREVFTPPQRRVVEAAFAPEIELFGYEF